MAARKKPRAKKKKNRTPAALRSSTARRIALKVRDRLQGTERGGFVCPFCRCDLSWETVKTSEIEVTIYVREKIYYCPACRAFLGVSSWHTEG